MSQNLQKLSILSIEPEPVQTSDKINRFFDKADLIVERCGALLSKSKHTFVDLFLVIHLVIDLIIVRAFVLSKVLG